MIRVNEELVRTQYVIMRILRTNKATNYIRAMTVTEIANLGKPSILVPLPNVSHNHQLYNAKVLENIGAAKIILNEELTGERLNQVIEELILDKTIMQKMGVNASKVAVSKVEDKIYEEIKKMLV